jgi:hypothetical protein
MSLSSAIEINEPSIAASALRSSGLAPNRARDSLTSRDLQGNKAFLKTVSLRFGVNNL